MIKPTNSMKTWRSNQERLVRMIRRTTKAVDESPELLTAKSTSFPVWSRDGRFTMWKFTKSNQRCFGFPSEGGEPELVVDLKDVRQIIGDGGR